MRNEIYMEKYLNRYTLENYDGTVQTVFEYASAAFNLCCNILGGMSANGISVLYPLHDDVTRVLIIANSRDELWDKAIWFYNKISSVADLHRGGSFDEPEVMVERQGRRYKR